MIENNVVVKVFYAINKEIFLEDDYSEMVRLMTFDELEDAEVAFYNNVELGHYELERIYITRDDIYYETLDDITVDLSL